MLEIYDVSYHFEEVEGCLLLFPITAKIRVGNAGTFELLHEKILRRSPTVLWFQVYTFHWLLVFVQKIKYIYLCKGCNSTLLLSESVSLSSVRVWKGVLKKPGLEKIFWAHYAGQPDDPQGQTTRRVKERRYRWPSEFGPQRALASRSSWTAIWVFCAPSTSLTFSRDGGISIQMLEHVREV